MCKRHWRAVHYPDQQQGSKAATIKAATMAAALKQKNGQQQANNNSNLSNNYAASGDVAIEKGDSIYETILPLSIAYRPTISSLAALQQALLKNKKKKTQQTTPAVNTIAIAKVATHTVADTYTTATVTVQINNGNNNNTNEHTVDTAGATVLDTNTNTTTMDPNITITNTTNRYQQDPTDEDNATCMTMAQQQVTTTLTAAGATTSSSSSGTYLSSAMPLVTYLRDGFLRKEVGWHRQSERSSRGLCPVPSLSSQLESWEKQLALVEIFLLSGGTPHANFKDLAHAWGRERGFHQVLALELCKRRGEVDRKRRSDSHAVVGATTMTMLRNTPTTTSCCTPIAPKTPTTRTTNTGGMRIGVNNSTNGTRNRNKKAKTTNTIAIEEQMTRPEEQSQPQPQSQTTHQEPPPPPTHQQQQLLQ